MSTAMRPDLHPGPVQMARSKDRGGFKQSKGSRPRRGKGKKTPKKNEDMAEYSREFLEGREDQPSGTMGWINFGQPERALELHQQKSNNPNEKRLGNTFAIKSFQVPHQVYDVISEDAVHERAKKQNPTKPINVDRETPNQFGLQQPHLELLNQTMLEGSARVEDPAEFEERYGAGLKETQKERKKAKKQHRKPARQKASNQGWHSKQARSSLGPSVDELDDIAADVEAMHEEDMRDEG